MNNLTEDAKETDKNISKLWPLLKLYRICIGCGDIPDEDYVTVKCLLALMVLSVVSVEKDDPNVAVTIALAVVMTTPPVAGSNRGPIPILQTSAFVLSVGFSFLRFRKIFVS